MKPVNDKYYMISGTREILKKKNPTKNPSKWQKRKSDLQVSEAGVGGGGDWSKMSKGYKLSDVKVVITM